MRHTIIFLFCSLLTFASFGQSDTSINKFLEGLPQEAQKLFRDQYQKSSLEERKSMLEMMNVFASMPQSSKKQLIQNVDTNYNNIITLKKFYNKLVQSNYSIYIEFHPADSLLKLDNYIDFWASKINNSTKRLEPIFQEWNVELKSSKLDSLLALVNLTRNDVQQLKLYLDKANCISINNTDVCEIGYARSGMGEYSYLIFDKPLTNKEQTQYNNGCEYIFYKRNIVLKYGGGAIGSQCFPDRE
jgi:hypothetical protein